MSFAARRAVYIATTASRTILRSGRVLLRRLHSSFMPSGSFAATSGVPHLLSAGSKDDATLSSNGSDNEDGLVSKNGDVELGPSSNNNNERENDQELRLDADGARSGHADGEGKAWAAQVESLQLPSADHIHYQHLPPFLSRSLLLFLGLPVVRPVASYISGPPKSKQRQPRLWKIPLLDAIEQFLVRYTRWAGVPWVLWIFLLAWFLGTTFLTRAAWYSSNVGNDTSSWLGGTDTYWLRNDGCGLGGLRKLWPLWRLQQCN